MSVIVEVPYEFGPFYVLSVRVQFLKISPNGSGEGPKLRGFFDKNEPIHVYLFPPEFKNTSFNFLQKLENNTNGSSYESEFFYVIRNHEVIIKFY